MDGIISVCGIVAAVLICAFLLLHIWIRNLLAQRAREARIEAEVKMRSRIFTTRFVISSLHKYHCQTLRRLRCSDHELSDEESQIGVEYVREFKEAQLEGVQGTDGEKGLPNTYYRAKLWRDAAAVLVSNVGVLYLTYDADQKAKYRFDIVTSAGEGTVLGVFALDGIAVNDLYRDLQITDVYKGMLEHAGE